MLVILVLLSLTSITTLFSIDAVRMPQQVISLAMGILIYLYLSQQDSRFFKQLSVPAYILAVIALAVTLFLGVNVRGTVGWVDVFGFRFQTAEFVKPLLILAFAEFIATHKPVNIPNILKNIALFALPFVLVFVQPDLGTALIIFVMWAAMIFIGNLPGIATAVAVGLMVLLGILSPYVLKDYQMERLTTFMDPSKDPLDTGYNVIQSMIAVGSGGILGKGLGRGTQSHLRFLPEKHTDFIFASLAEEFGLAGSLALIALFALLFYRLLDVLGKLRDIKNRLIVTGVFTYVFFQAFLNIAMNIGIAPVTGITLPLISFGRSSVLSTFIALGLAASVMHGIKSKPSIEIK